MAKTAAQLNREIAAALAKPSTPERSPYGNALFKNGSTKPAAEIIARRKTFDDKEVALWNDGTLTWGRWNLIKGSPAPRTDKQIEEALRAGWLVVGEIELFNADDVPRLIEVSRKVAARGGGPSDVRAGFAKQVKLAPVWAVLETNRDGSPRVRVWKLPRLTHAGLAVWDTPGASRGRYEVMQEARAGGLGQRSGGGTYAPTGVRFKDLKGLANYLRETSQLRR